MATSRLRSFVHVFDSEGQAHVFGPEDDVPDWAAEKITNSRAWETPPQRTVETASVDFGSDAPPRSGAGSGQAAWLKHARSLGLAVEDDASRDDLIAAVDAAGEVSDSDDEE